MAYSAGNSRHAAAQANGSRSNGSRRHPLSSDRSEMLEQLGLHPSAQVDGLMTIFRCASNTSALRPRKLESLLRAKRDNQTATRR